MEPAIVAVASCFDRANDVYKVRPTWPLTASSPVRTLAVRYIVCRLPGGGQGCRSSVRYDPSVASLCERCCDEVRLCFTETSLLVRRFSAALSGVAIQESIPTLTFDHGFVQD
ncbi:hypothetical protein HPB48_001230 [Haemaphysalis longicornis]|uniref:Uncharacterized protein n=1 Tax=Haemaphysalis longicornis TaxID=44386 RepID=A0A9J6FJX8_HAELO|nr:hypothetical protein HPB48_001230 [Haemaphysalis longicornis]